MSRVTQPVKGTAKTQSQLGEMKMNKLWQSFRRKKDVSVPEASRPRQGQTDAEGVRTGKCPFPVKDRGPQKLMSQEEGTGVEILWQD